LGSTGADVFSLQQLLDQQGLLSASPTGYFGPLTQAAVAQFQTAHNLEAVGSVGPLTRAALDALTAAHAASSTLTGAQIQAILSLLRSFGADQPTIARISAALGAPPATSTATTTTAVGSGSTSTTTASSYSPGVTPLPGYTPTQIILGGGSSTPAPTCTLSATPASIAIGSSTLLSWSSTNASSASLNQSIGSVGLSGSQSVSPATNTTYTLTVTNPTGSNTCSTSVATNDTQTPTAATNLTAVAASLSELDLSWSAASDNVGVAGYKVFRDGVQIATDTSGTTYADAGLIASSTHAYTVKAYDAANNVSLASNTATSTTGVWADGFAQAPTGSAQQPNILQSYAARPPWRVAGVDYAVGIIPGTVLKDPTTATLPSGVSWLSASNRILIVATTSSPVTLDGYDFSLHGGLWVYIVGQANGGGGAVTITNSNFKVGSNNLQPIQSELDAGNLTLEYDDFDGGGSNGGVSVNNAVDKLVTTGSGSETFKYDLFKNAWSDSIDVNSGATVTAEYNLFEANGFNEIAHGDFLQTVGGGNNNLLFQFNTGYQPAADASGFPTALNSMIRIGDPVPTSTNPTISFNTAVGVGTSGHMGTDGFTAHPAILSYVQLTTNGAAGAAIVNPVVSNNYFDPSVVENFVFYPTGSQNIANPAYSNNINMTTGATIPSP
jgi:peptidoglycan hydrolase-like protein with peptidoglycan-binding domain